MGVKHIWNYKKRPCDWTSFNPRRVASVGRHLQLIRWVIGYRYMESQTKNPEIPFSFRDELFDRMAGCAMFTVMDLAQGYQQMLVKSSSHQYTAFRMHKDT